MPREEVSLFYLVVRKVMCKCLVVVLVFCALLRSRWKMTANLLARTSVWNWPIPENSLFVKVSMHFVRHALLHNLFSHVSWSGHRKICSNTSESDQHMSVRWVFA